MNVRLAPFIAVVALALATSGCVMNRLDTDPQTIVLRESGDAPVRIRIEPGPEWSSRMQAGPLVFNVVPQFAIWTEDAAGNLVETLYVTGAGFEKMRHAAKQERQAEFFAECLPVWSARVVASGADLPSKANPYPDAITSATPGGPTTLVTALERPERPVALFVEINKSDDVNHVFTRERNDWAGQPSLIYSAQLDADAFEAELRLELVGHGGLLGDRPRIRPDVSGFDTALRQVDAILVLVE